jgi:hypothetical protein
MARSRRVCAVNDEKTTDPRRVGTRPRAIIRCCPPEIAEVFRDTRLGERLVRLGVITSD